jgi:hypothetical protein
MFYKRNHILYLFFIPCFLCGFACGPIGDGSFDDITGELPTDDDDAGPDDPDLEEEPTEDGIDSGIAEPSGPGVDAYYIMDSLFITKKADSSCNLDGKPGLDNTLVEMINQVIQLPGLGNFKTTLNDIISALITSRNGVILGLAGVHDFVDDNAVATSGYEGILDSDAGLIDAGGNDIFSGHGAIALADQPFWTVENSTIIGKELSTEPATLHFGELLFDISLQMASVIATLDPEPDDDLLGGQMINGTICGAVTLDEVQVIMDQFGGVLTPAIENIVNNFIKGQADIKCDDTDKAKDCLSFGINFTAVSVGIAE